MISFTTYWGMIGECGFRTMARGACYFSLPQVWKKKVQVYQADTAKWNHYFTSDIGWQEMGE